MGDHRRDKPKYQRGQSQDAPKNSSLCASRLKGRCKAGDTCHKKHKTRCKFVMSPGDCKLGKSCLFPHHSPALKVEHTATREATASAESVCSQASNTSDKATAKAKAGGRRQSPARNGRGRSSSPKKATLIRTARVLELRSTSALRGDG